MRRTLLMIMAVALLLTQCRKPAVELTTAEPTNENMVSMTVTVGHGGKPMAKVIEEQADIYAFILYNMGK